MIVFFVYNILIFNYKDTKNYRDYQLFKRISYPELRYEGIIVLSDNGDTFAVVRNAHSAKVEHLPAI